jgi:hypothetical protein
MSPANHRLRRPVLPVFLGRGRKSMTWKNQLRFAIALLRAAQPSH